MKIISRQNALECGQKWYFTGVSCKNGHIEKRGVLNRSCYGCMRTRSSKYREGHRDYFRKKNHQYYSDNKENISEYGKERYRRMKQDDPDVFKEKDARNHKTYRVRHLDKIKERNRVYCRNNKGVINAKNAKRRAKKLKATPLWVDYDKIREIYKECQRINNNENEKYVVDHIIPLQGKTVSGLHIPENLRIVTESENCEKHNKFFEELI